MHIIFLDIDGVLVGNFMVPAHKRTKEAVAGFNPQAVGNLNRLIQACIKTGQTPGIVLSSSWRTKVINEVLELHTLEYLKDLFQEHDFSKYIIDVVPIVTKNDDAWYRRRCEIKKWLDSHKYDEYIVLDDMKGLSCFKNRFIHCKGDLFGDKELEKAIQHFVR